MSSAKMVGRSVQLSLQKLMDKWDNLLDDFFFQSNHFRHECLGDIRGSGLIWAIEIVNNKRENKPVSNCNCSPLYQIFFSAGTKASNRNNV